MAGFLCSFSLLFWAVLYISAMSFGKTIGAADARRFLNDPTATFGSVDTRFLRSLQAVGYVLSQRNFDPIASYSAAKRVYFNYPMTTKHGDSRQLRFDLGVHDIVAEAIGSGRWDDDLDLETIAQVITEHALRKAKWTARYARRNAANPGGPP